MTRTTYYFSDSSTQGEDVRSEEFRLQSWPVVQSAYRRLIDRGVCLGPLNFDGVQDIGGHEHLVYSAVGEKKAA